VLAIMSLLETEGNGSQLPFFQERQVFTVFRLAQNKIKFTKYDLAQKNTHLNLLFLYFRNRNRQKKKQETLAHNADIRLFPPYTREVFVYA